VVQGLAPPDGVEDVGRLIVCAEPPPLAGQIMGDIVIAVPSDGGGHCGEECVQAAIDRQGERDEQARYPRKREVRP